MKYICRGLYGCTTSAAAECSTPGLPPTVVCFTRLRAQRVAARAPWVLTPRVNEAADPRRLVPKNDPAVALPELFWGWKEKMNDLEAMHKTTMKWLSASQAECTALRHTVKTLECETEIMRREICAATIEHMIVTIENA